MSSSEGITPHKDVAELLFFHFMDKNVHKKEEPAPRMEEPTPKSWHGTEAPVQNTQDSTMEWKYLV